MKFKIISHVIAIAFLLIGIVVIHVAYNHIDNHFYPYPPLLFFSLELRPGVLFDIGLILIFSGFSIEFYNSFRPLEVSTT